MQWESTDSASSPHALDATGVYRDHADFVYRSLQHLGIPEADLEDALQEVFLVVHRRLTSFDGSSRLTTWLFGICMRVSSHHHRHARLWRRRPLDSDLGPDDSSSPESACSAQQARAMLERALSRLSLEHRAVFLLFEVEGQSCPEIAELLGIPVGTVHSRLYVARKKVTKALERIRRRSTPRGQP